MSRASRRRCGGSSPGPSQRLGRIGVAEHGGDRGENGVSGVRSSWRRVARKRSLARLAASASARAGRSRSMRTRSSAARLVHGDVTEDEHPAGRMVCRRRGARSWRRTRTGVRARAPSSSKLRSPCSGINPSVALPARASARMHRATSSPRISRQGPAESRWPPGSARRCGPEASITMTGSFMPSTTDRPGHRRQIEQPVTEQAGQERQPGDRERHRGRIDVDEAEDLRHVDDVDDPRQITRRASRRPARDRAPADVTTAWARRIVEAATRT